MQVIENSIIIDRPAEDVFDYCSDMRTEVVWNPAAAAITLLSTEPLDVGTRFEGRWKGAGTSTLEIIAFDRPTTWTTHTTTAKMPFRLTGTVILVDKAASQLTMRIELLPTGGLAVLGPVIRLMMQSTAKANVARIKTAVENS